VRKVGVLGGTFDPLHIGHLILAEYTRETLDLDLVLFVPAGENPFKVGQIRSAVEHRVAMVEIAIADNPYFQLSRVDIDRPPPHYSADMLEQIQAVYPETQLYFLMGGDNLRDFPKWTRAEEILNFARLAVMRRSDEDVSADMHAAVMPDLAQHVDIIDTPLYSVWVSSTDMVDRLQRGLSTRYLIPDAIRNYIHEHNLYTEHEC
jgi:nicotinate-nucleotide adenylyltransferase